MYTFVHDSGATVAMTNSLSSNELADQPDETNKNDAGRTVRPTAVSPDTAQTPSTAVSQTPKSMVGQYAQRTFRLPPDYLDMIRQIAQQEIMSIADAERWVVNRGLLAYFEDGERPTFERSVQRSVHLPDIQQN